MKSARKAIIAANWKMYKTIQEMEEYLAVFLPLIQNIADREIVIAPNFMCLEKMSAKAKGTPLEVAAQNMYYEEQGAFTGETSPLMLRACGIKWVILGHSERRHIFGESNELIGKKVRSALDHGLSPILCIGETLEQRDAGETEAILKEQLQAGLSGVKPTEIAGLAIAYEPVWAIGTGRTASLEQIQDAHQVVREEVRNLAGEDVAESLRILYGGSVKPVNVGDIMGLDDVDGALVGGASLEPESFIKIVRFDKS